MNVDGPAGHSPGPQPSAGPAPLGAPDAEGSPVRSYSEWDPLEEVIVGVATGSAIPRESERMIRSTMPNEWQEMLLDRGGSPFPTEVVDAAQAENR